MTVFNLHSCMEAPIEPNLHRFPSSVPILLFIMQGGYFCDAQCSSWYKTSKTSLLRDSARIGCLNPLKFAALSPLPIVKNVTKTIARQTKNLESFQFLEKFCMFLVDIYMFTVCSSYVVVCCFMFLLYSGTPKKVLECSKLSRQFV